MMGERFRVVPAAYVVLQRGPEVLLQLRQGTGYRDGHWAVAAAGHVVERRDAAFVVQLVHVTAGAGCGD